MLFLARLSISYLLYHHQRRPLARHIVARLTSKSNQRNDKNLSILIKMANPGSFSKDKEIVGVQIVISACKLSPNANNSKSSEKKGLHIFVALLS